MQIQTMMTVEDISTIRLALSGWAARCDQEAKTMRELADEFTGETHVQCLRNAEAPAKFAREARETLARLP